MVAIDPANERASPVYDRGSDPFSTSILNDIFKLHAGDSLRLHSRENSRLEFKEAFNWGNATAYARTAAAFANRSGGYIAFGVADSPRRIVGMRNDRFEDMDPATISSFLNDLFDPALEWDVAIYEVGDKRVGLLYFAEAEVKPVICRQNKGKCRDGEIYFRYRGQTRKISSGDLQSLLQKQREREAKQWQRVFRDIVRTGVENAGVLDLTSGSVRAGGRTLVIDPEVAKHLKVIDEAQLVQRDGAPAHRLVGDVANAGSRVLVPGKTITRHVRIDDTHVVGSYLKGAKIDSPTAFIEQICHERTCYLPMYYYIKVAGMSLDDAREFIKAQRVPEHSRTKLLKRLDSDDDFTHPTPRMRSATSRAREGWRDQFMKKRVKVVVEDDTDLKYALQGLRLGNPSELPLPWVRKRLHDWLGSCYTHRNGTIDDEFRRAVCHLDRTENRAACEGA